MFTCILLQEYDKAVEAYQQFYALCEKMEDDAGQSLAYNYMACTIQERENTKLTLAMKHAKKSAQKPGEFEIPDEIKSEV
jgi:hypothetical protein